MARKAYRIAISSLIGCIIAIGYAFISYYLLSDLIRENLYSLIFYGIQGLIFGASFSTLIILAENMLPRSLDKHKTIYNIIVGSISGLVGCSLSIYVGWKDFSDSSSRSNFYTPPEIINEQIFQLQLFVLGNILLGSLVGYCVGYLKKTHKKAENNPL